MTNDVNREKAREDYYEKFYGSGGWKYNIPGEIAWLGERLFTPLGIVLHEDYSVLEAGCGMGMQAEALRQLGASVTGVDSSEAGIASAREKYPEATFVCCDLAVFHELDGYPKQFDLVFIRGLSWFHYKLEDDADAHLGYLMQFVKPGGHVVLLIKTDFSGEYTGPNGVLNNRLRDYRKLFNDHGDIVLCTDWDGQTLGDDGNPPKNPPRNIIIVITPRCE